MAFRPAPFRPAPVVPRTDLLDPETDELVAGRRPVEEAFVARREARRLLVVPQRRQALEKLVLHATNLRIPIVEVEGGTLTALAGFDGHQGVALVVAPRRYADVDEILARAIERHEPAFVLVLDSLEDPHNVGTLLRSAEAAGTHGVVFPTHRQAPLTPSAIKASAGAVEHLLLAPVDDLAGTLADLHARGLRVVGADADASLTVREADLRGPLALVVGSEGQGLGPAVRRRCDLLVRIPMRGAVGSLNASVAGSILLYEASTQRGIAEAPDRPSDPVEDTPAVDEPAVDEPATDDARSTASVETGVVPELPAVAASAPPAPKRRRATAAPAAAATKTAAPKRRRATAVAPAVAATKTPAPKRRRATAVAPAVAATKTPAPKRSRAAAAAPDAAATEPPAPKRRRSAGAATAPDASVAGPADDATELLPGEPARG